MDRRTYILIILVPLLALTQSCLITNRDFETLKDQVRLEQKALSDLQRKVEESAMQLDGMENSLQMIEARIEDNSERIEDIEAGIASEARPAREFVLPGPLEKEPTIAGLPPETAPEEEEGSFYTPRAYTSEEDLYKSAYDHFEEGDYGQAILEFEEYVANYQNTDLADNAQYWIGECYYAQQDYRQAIREFDKVERNFPEGNKVPASKIKKGFAYREMGNVEEALRELREVEEKFPSSEEALLAREKLKLWKQEGTRNGK